MYIVVQLPYGVYSRIHNAMYEQREVRVVCVSVCLSVLVCLFTVFVVLLSLQQNNITQDEHWLCGSVAVCL